MYRASTRLVTTLTFVLLSAFLLSCGSDKENEVQLQTASSKWEASNFQLPPNLGTCSGARYIKFSASQQKYVGVVLCTAKKYKLFLAAAKTGPFLELADGSGHGQDHCELINPKFTIPNDDEITSGGCSNCNVADAGQVSPPHSQYYSRANFGEAFEIKNNSGQWSGEYSNRALSCGVSIP